MRFGFVKDGQRHAAKRFDDDEDDLFWAIEIARLLFTDIRLCKWVVGRFEFPTAIASHDPIVLNALDNRARRVSDERDMCVVSLIIVKKTGAVLSWRRDGLKTILPGSLADSLKTSATPLPPTPKAMANAMIHGANRATRIHTCGW